jgi:hypothetical protein
MNAQRVKDLLREALAELDKTEPVDPVNPVDPVTPTEPVNTGEGLVVWGEIRVTTPAIFSGFFTQKVALTVVPIGGGGRMIPCELIANGKNLGQAPRFILEPGSYQLILKGGSQVSGARQSVVARPA